MKLSVVVSVFNEEEVLDEFWGRLAQVLGEGRFDSEVIFVNDGSTDDSRQVLERLSVGDSRVRVINFSRNFGHEAAMIAGIDHATGDALVCLDADLQHPPDLIPEMWEQFRKGNEIVTMVRSESEGKGFFRDLGASLFYRLLNLVSPEDFTVNASDFFLVSARVCKLLTTQYRERARFHRGLIQIVGFQKTSLEFVAPERAGGRSKYSLLALLMFSLSAIAAFSRLPLRLGLFTAVLCGSFALIVGAYTIAMKMMGHVVPGYTTIVVLISFLFAVQFLVIGLIGEYVGFLFEEAKKRPIYVVESVVRAGEEREA